MKIEDVKKLIAEGESKRLEFKTSTGVLKSACETLCAFINTKGGVVLIGVKDDHSIPGQDVTDKTRQEIANEIAKFEPLHDINIEYIPLENGKNVIAMSVAPNNLSTPCTFDGRPYLRIESSTKRMTQQQYNTLLLQEANKFELSNAEREKQIKNRIKKFVEKRLLFLQSGKGEFYEKCTDPYLIVHYIPLSTFENESTIDTDRISQSIELINIPVFYNNQGPQDPILNENGFLIYTGNTPNLIHHCTQVFRDGTIEIRKKIKDENQKIYPKTIEHYLKCSYSMYKNYLSIYRIDLPFLVYINFLNIKDYSLPTLQLDHETQPYSYDKSNLNLKVIEIVDLDSDFESNFKSTLKAFYNSFQQLRLQK